MTPLSALSGGKTPFFSVDDSFQLLIKTFLKLLQRGRLCQQREFLSKGVKELCKGQPVLSAATTFSVKTHKPVSRLVPSNGGVKNSSRL